MWNQRPNRCADYCTGGAGRRASLRARDARTKLTLATAGQSCADPESGSKSHNRAGGGPFRATLAAREMLLYFEYILFCCGNRPYDYLLRRPVLEHAFRGGARFQGQADLSPGVQLSDGLPVMHILSFGARPEHAHEQ